VRAALAGLTGRGRLFALVGLVGMVAGLVAGERDLLRVGVLLAALPLVAALAVARSRYRLSCGRRVDPARVAVGDPVAVRLALENVSRVPTGVLLAEDRVPFALGAPARFVLDRVASRGSCLVPYTLTPAARGRYSIGPLTLRLRDPFGMCELARSFTAVTPLVVTPAVAALPPAALGGEWSGTGSARAHAVAAAGEDDVGVREYHRGDERRRVHWPATARYGSLMVRREEQAWEARAWVVLDTRTRAHAGTGLGGSFETAVSAAASVGVYLAAAGFTVGLLTEGGDSVGTSAGPDGAAGLLDGLAEVQASQGADFSGAGRALRRSGDGLTVVVAGRLGAGDAAQVARLRPGTGSAVAVLLDVASYAPAADADPPTGAAALLASTGWRVVALDAGATLADRWVAAGTRAPRVAAR